MLNMGLQIYPNNLWPLFTFKIFHL